MSHYDWVWGNPPPLLKRHSEVKHALLRNYLVEYFLTLVTVPRQETIRMTIVDGFCGGGLYRNESGQDVPGSPLIILEAIREAELLVAQRKDRRTGLKIDVELICIDTCRYALDYLRHVLEERGYGAALASDSIRLIRGDFAEMCDAVIQRAHNRSPKSGRAIFVLDQYGYSAVPVHCLKDIFSSLGKAEVILTFYIDALLNYLNEKNLADFEKALGISATVTAAEIDELKKSPLWRVHLQSSLYQSLTGECSAQFYTPFFIRPEQGHGDFWLLHLSQHWKARDVMATTHWQHHNHFAHYGDAGFNMFSTGYIGKLDDGNKLQMGFDFSDVAAAVSKETMMEQIPKMLFQGNDGITFERFFLTLINGTPATRTMVADALLDLHKLKEIHIEDLEGGVSRPRQHLQPEHVLRISPQQHFGF